MKPVRAMPIPVPNKVEAVYCDTDLPWMSAKLLFLANWRFILALEADDSIKHTFLPMLAKEAIIKKY